MKIAILSPQAHLAGHHWTMATHLAAALRSANIHSQVCVSHDPKPQGDSSNSPLITGFCLFTTLSRVLSQFLTPYHPVLRNLQAWSCGVAITLRCIMNRPTHLFLVDSTFWMAALLPRILRIPTVYYVTSGLEPSKRGKVIGKTSVSIRALKAACHSGWLHFVCENRHVQAEVAASVGDHVSVIPYAIALPEDLPDKATSRRRLKLPENQEILLIFGTHRVGKNYNIVFEACSRLSPSPFLLFAGKVISDNDPERAAAKANFSNFVSHDVFIPDDEMPYYFAAADCVVLPYDGNYQKGSGVLLESLRFECPVIAPEVGFFKQFLDEFRCGFLYRQDDSEDLAKAIQSATQLSDEARAGLEDLVKSAAIAHSWEAILPKYLELLSKMAKLG